MISSVPFMLGLAIAACGTSLVAVAGFKDGTVETVAGNGTRGYGGGRGIATDMPIDQPFGLSLGPDGHLYFCEVGTHVVRRLELATGLLTTVAGVGHKGYSGDHGPADQAELNEPYELRFDSEGNLFIVEMMNHVVRRVDAESHLITTIAGTGNAGFSGDGGPARSAQLNRPHSIVLDDQDGLYVCDIGNHRVRRVDLKTRLISTYAGTGEKQRTPDGAPLAGTPLHGPRALDFDGRHSLILALREGNAIYRIDMRTRTLHHVAGTGSSGYAGDGGPARDALLSGPKGISLSPNGDIYFADTESHTIRVVRSDSGIAETVVGDGVRGNGPSGPAHHCRLDRPHGVCVGPDGRVWIGDSNNHQVRVLKCAD